MARFRKFRKTLRRKRGIKRSLRRRSHGRKQFRRFRSENSHSYRLTRSITQGVAVAAVTANSGFFTLDPTLFAQWNDIASLYDQYKIKYCTVTFRPCFNALSTTITEANYNAYFHTVLDFDSPPSLSLNRGAVYQYRNMRRTQLSRSHSRTFVPKYLVAQNYIDSSGTTQVTYRPGSGFMDTASPPVMYNLYYYIDPMLADTPTDNLFYNVEITCHITAKNVR